MAAAAPENSFADADVISPLPERYYITAMAVALLAGLGGRRRRRRVVVVRGEAAAAIGAHGNCCSHI